MFGFLLLEGKNSAAAHCNSCFNLFFFFQLISSLQRHKRGRMSSYISSSHRLEAGTDYNTVLSINKLLFLSLCSCIQAGQGNSPTLLPCLRSAHCHANEIDASRRKRDAETKPSFPHLHRLPGCSV